MRKYNVIWNDTSQTKGGCVTVYARNIMEAITNARNILQMGGNFRVVRVYEGR